LVEDDFEGITRINGAAPPPASVNPTTCNDPYVALFGQNGPPTTSGSGPTPSTHKSSTTTKSTASTFPTTTATTTSGTSGPGHTTATTEPGTVVTVPITKVTLPGGIVAGAHGTTTTTDDPTVGIALFGTAGKMDGVAHPATPAVLIALGFLLLIAVPPLIAWVRFRRRRQAGGVS
jgi:cytoskeletal protein RodZ